MRPQAKRRDGDNQRQEYSVRNVALRSRRTTSGLWRRHLDLTARLLPGTEAAPDMRYRFQPHRLRGLSRQRRSHAARTEEHIGLVLGERVLVIGALRVDPEFQHAARA